MKIQQSFCLVDFSQRKAREEKKSGTTSNEMFLSFSYQKLINFQPETLLFKLSSFPFHNNKKSFPLRLSDYASLFIVGKLKGATVVFMFISFHSDPKKLTALIKLLWISFFDIEFSLMKIDKKTNFYSNLGFE
jgi:hypothetical protein